MPITLKNKYIIISFCAIIAIGFLYYISTLNYLITHTLIELVATVVAVTLFSIGWCTRKYSHNNFMIIIAVSYLVVGFLTTVHSLTYPGLGTYPNHDANISTQFWIAARYVESISLLLANHFINHNKKSNSSIILIGFILVSIFICISIFLEFFPICYKA